MLNPLLSQQGRQLYRTEHLHLARHPVTAAMPGTAIKETRCTATQQKSYSLKLRHKQARESNAVKYLYAAVCHDRTSIIFMRLKGLWCDLE